MNSRLSRLLLCGLLVIATACGEKKLLPTQPLVDSPVAAVARPDLEPERRGRGAASIIGREQGAIFALHRPERWNGRLVVYIHGFTPPQAPIALPTADFIDPIRDRLLSLGFAVAYSSWSENGFAVRNAIESSDRLPELFADRLGKPSRVYLVASSLGGLAAMALAERRHDPGSKRSEGRDSDRENERERNTVYSGALLLSPVSGGSRHEIEYIGNIRVLFDYFYPGVLPGDLLHLPANLDVVGPAGPAQRL